MNRVGEQLTEIAVRADDTTVVDLFGRSAINRYYYACFLETRKAVRAIRPSLTITHKQLPDDLKGTIVRTVRKEIKRKRKSGLISRSFADSSGVMVNQLVGDLAELLTKAYKLRVIADYEPEIRAYKESGHVVLGGSSTVDARDWHRRATTSVGRMLRLWSELGN